MYIAGTKVAVETGDTYFTEVGKLAISGSTTAKAMVNRNYLKSKPIYIGKILEAKINYARFIVGCPNCNNTEFMFEDKLFFCSLCQNSNIGGKVYQVVFPVDRKSIEEILSLRPIINRHWNSSESLADLKKENTEHRLEVA